MDYGPFYSIYQLAMTAEKIISLIDKFQITFFTDKNLPYDRQEILCSIQVGKIIKTIDNKIPTVSHPAIHRAIKSIDFDEKKELEDDVTDNEITSHSLYTDLITLVSSMIGIISDVYEKTIEAKINEVKYDEALKILTIEKQSGEYDNTHPKSFIARYREFLNKRINDLKELIELDNMSFGAELKEIIESYKLGLEVNVKGRNLLTPLLQKNYKLLISNIKNALSIPSYYDICKNEKEKSYHVYLLGVLEGRLSLYILKSNKESGFGRYDICAFPINKKNPGLIIEIKTDKTGVEKALTQIKSNNYVNELRVEGVQEVLALAINIQPKEILTAYDVIYFD